MSTYAHSLAKSRKRLPRHQPAYVIMFVRLHATEARIVAARSGIPVEIILAQSALESDWGRTVEGNAYFGIKDKSSTGTSTSFATHKVTLSGQRVSEVDEFRAYADYAEAADDYASSIRRKYPAAFAYRDAEKFAETLAGSGYATDPAYARKLKSIIHFHVAPPLDKSSVAAK